MDTNSLPEDRQSVGAAAAETQAEQAVELCKQALQACLNLDWEACDRLRQAAQQRVAGIEGDEGERARTAVRAFTTMAEAMALQLHDGGADRFERAKERFQETRARIEELLEQTAVETARKAFQDTLFWVDMQILWADRSMARECGDRRGVLVKEAQMQALIESASAEARLDMAGILAILRFTDVMARIKESTSALGTMDLERALRLITEIRREAGAALQTIRQEMPPGVLVQSGEKIMTGAYEYVEALAAYVTSLHDAVVGDVTQDHLAQLTRAEELLHSGTRKLLEGSTVVRPASEEQAEALEAALEGPVTLVRNLRHLCSESLEPRRWLAVTSVRFVVVFLVTAASLVGAVAYTQVGRGLAGQALIGYTLVVSLVVGLIAGYGYDALRFIGFVDRLLKSLPKGSGATNYPQDKSGRS